MRYPVDPDQTGVYLYHDDGSETFYPTRGWFGPSRIFYDHNSGKIWAKAVSGTWAHGWHSTVTRLNQDPIYGPAYSLILSYDKEFFLALSDELLNREIELLLAEPNYL